jgi:hypothetical protein
VAKTKVWKSDSKRTVEMMSDEAKKIKEQIEQELESFSPLYWSYNLPLQMALEVKALELCELVASLSELS